MNRRRLLRVRARIHGALALLLALGPNLPAPAVANPKGEKVVSGQADFNRNGSTLTVTTSDRVVVHWDQFNIAPGELTRFVQPGSSSIALNRILDSNPSQIFGSLQANGNVFLLNPNGILFGPNSRVNVNGLVATSLSIEDQDFLNGKLKFAGFDGNGAVKNLGTIETAKGGFAYLLAPNVENGGVIRSPEGHIVLAAGTTAYLSNRPDGKGLLVEVKAPAGAAVNLRELVADGGRVGIYGRAVNQSGIVQANTVRERAGEIELVASDRVYLESGSLTEARGEETGVSAGGDVTLLSGGGSAGQVPSGDAIVKAGSVVDVSGGREGGDAGRAEISASGGMVLEGEVRGEAAPGFRGGELLIDPVNVTITAFGAPNGPPVVNPPGTGTWAFDSPALPLNLVLNTFSSFTGLSVIRVEATDDITIASSTAWTLAPTVTDLTLRAGDDILFGTGAGIFDAGATAGPLTLNLIAGADFQAADPFAVHAGVGDILGPTLQIGQGTIKAVAGGGIQLNDGAIRTTRGGSIDLAALDGDIDAGRNTTWLIPFGASSVRISPSGAGGIATQAGGNISLMAPNGFVSSDSSHIGAYSIGAGAAGNLTIRARDFTGEFFVGNGHADVRLSGHFGTAVRSTTIDLATGSTAYVEAADIHLGQIRNPQGVISTTHRFNYGNAGVELVATAGDVELAGDVNAGNTEFNLNMNGILAPNLTVRSLAGDILINNDFVLFPSATGNLVLDAHGDITNSRPFTINLPDDSVPPDRSASPLDGAARMPSITVSDADPLRQSPPLFGSITEPDYRQNFSLYYAETHAAVPVHTGDTTPIRISTTEGDVRRVAFNFPKASLWDIGGDVGIIAFNGQNLAPTDVTRFDIHGNLDWSQRIADIDGIPVIVDGRGDDPIFTAIRLGGPGTLEINAGGFVDLGESEGIQTVGTLFNKNLDDNSPGVPDILISDNGAAIRMRVGPDTLGGQGTPVQTPKGLVNQQNFSLINSRVASFGGGAIDVAVNNGDLVVGAGSIGTVDSILARGIYTAVGGAITLVALKDVNVKSSRVGTFHGGDINITAVKGSINAGEGTLDQPSEVPAIGDQGLAFEIAGTGIISSTLPPSDKLPTVTPGAINLKAGTEVKTGAAGITCTGANASACNVNIIGNVTLGAGGITSGGNVSISGNVTGAGTISGGSVNIGGTVTGGTISASSGSGAVASAAASAVSTTPTETSQVAKAASGDGGGDGTGTEKKKRRRYFRRGVIIEVTGRPAA